MRVIDVEIPDPVVKSVTLEFTAEELIAFHMVLGKCSGSIDSINGIIYNIYNKICAELSVPSIPYNYSTDTFCLNSFSAMNISPLSLKKKNR